MQTSPIIDAQFFSEVSGSSRLGGRAEFYCAGIGKPAPYVSWQNVSSGPTCLVALILQRDQANSVEYPSLNPTLIPTIFT